MERMQKVESGVPPGLLGVINNINNIVNIVYIIVDNVDIRPLDS